MAQTTYTTPIITLATRAVAYQRLATALQHFDGLGLNLISIIKNADNSASVTLSDPLSPEQAVHLGLS